jgi:hypothetical protein
MREQDADFLARVDLLSAAGKMVLVTDMGAFHTLGEYLGLRIVADKKKGR